MQKVNQIGFPIGVTSKTWQQTERQSTSCTMTLFARAEEPFWAEVSEVKMMLSCGALHMEDAWVYVEEDDGLALGIEASDS